LAAVVDRDVSYRDRLECRLGNFRETATEDGLGYTLSGAVQAVLTGHPDTDLSSKLRFNRSRNRFTIFALVLAEQRINRRLVAILAADAVGYSCLMEADELGTLAAARR
jgi:hypothetical protein